MRRKEVRKEKKKDNGNKSEVGPDTVKPISIELGGRMGPQTISVLQNLTTKLAEARGGELNCRLHRGSLLHCAQLRPSGPLLRHHMPAAAFDHLPQQVARLGVWPPARQRRPDGRTSKPRAGRGATAETTPKALFLLSSASWLWHPSANSILVPGAEVVGVFFATRRLLGQCLCAFLCIARAIAS